MSVGGSTSSTRDSLNFCYKCGLLSHSLKECPKVQGDKSKFEMDTLQHEAWLRGDLIRRNGGDVGKPNGGGEGYKF